MGAHVRTYKVTTLDMPGPSFGVALCCTPKLRVKGPVVYGDTRYSFMEIHIEIMDDTRGRYRARS